MAADAKEPNRRAIRSVDWVSQKTLNQAKKSEKIAEQLGLTYKEYQELVNQLCIKAMSGEISIQDYKTQLQALKVGA